ncbi:putative ABC transport system permease protein [Lachnospiraceae bacterium XPB1003]|nr:putative ABC transport system permease protein [Lachnospiraceae bacterium XPB1003]
MRKVNNKKVISDLAFSGIKSNIKKYIVLIGAVILTTLLFSSLFTVGGSLIEETQIATMREIGTSYHAGLKYMSMPEYEQVKGDKGIKDISYCIIVGYLSDDRLNKLPTEVYYSEEQNAKKCFCYPEVGRLPEKENEIATSDLVLEKLGVPAVVGSTFKADLLIDGEVVSKEFVLSGYYRGDRLAMAQAALVSKELQEKLAPVRMITYPEREDNSYAGWMSVNMDFKNNFNVEESIIALIDRTGLRQDVDYGINYAYAGYDIDLSMAVVCGLMLITFFVAGYLIIYNIFDINIISDMQEYGLLKTIGTTGKQLKKIVMKRANIISLIGIPVGLLMGVGVGSCILPFISDHMATMTVDKGSVHFNILFLAGAALFSYLTVIISAGRPCRKASKVSPIEVLRYTDGSENSRKKGGKHTIVILSLSLALIILNGVIGLVSGFDVNEFVKSDVVADFSIQDASLDSMAASFHETDSVDEDLLEKIKSQPGVTDLGNIYISTFWQEFSDENWEQIEDKFFTDEAVKECVNNWYTDINYSYDDCMNDFRRSKTMAGNTYGMGEFAVSKLKVVKTIDGTDTIDWEKFNSGDYVLATRWTSDGRYYADIVEPGDKVQIRSHDPKYAKLVEEPINTAGVTTYTSYDDAPVKEYEVYAVVDIPQAMIYRLSEFIELDYILPESEYLSLEGDKGAMRTLVDVEDDKEAAFEGWIKDYTSSEEPDMSYTSKESVIAEYKSLSDTIGMVGVVLAVILGLIGLMNFANTMVTSIIVRSRELAVLEAVGMTGVQLKHKLMKEGFTYFLWTMIVSLILSSILNVTAIRFLADELGMFVWRFTLMPEICCLPLILVLIIMIPVIAFNRLSKRSIIDRLRVE